MIDRSLLFGSPRSALVTVLCLLGTAASAQTSSQTPDPQATQPIQTLPQATPQDRAQVLRDAQARVEMRRRQRQQLIIEDTYSHKYEAYFGGGYERFRPGASLQHLSEAAWNIGVTEWVRPKLGITGDLRGYYGTAYTGINAVQVFKPSISEYTFMAGPQYRVYEAQRWAVSAQVLAGAGHGNFNTGTGGFPSAVTGLWPDGTAFNLSAGASFDYNLSPALAIRLTPNYLFSNYGSTFEHSPGFTTGFLYRWGRQ